MSPEQKERLQKELDGELAISIALIPAAMELKPSLENELVVALENLAGLFKALHSNHASWGDYQAARSVIEKARGMR